MKARRCPKGAIDWHDELLKAARCRRAISVHENRRDQNRWEDAIRHLEKSQKSIHVQQNGQNKGIVVGIPEKISNAIQQIFIKIVEGDEVAIPVGHESHVDARIEDDKMLRTIAYRSSNYALLAALYEIYKGPCEHVRHLLIGIKQLGILLIEIMILSILIPVTLLLSVSLYSKI